MNTIIAENMEFLKKSEKFSFKQEFGLAVKIYSLLSFETKYSNMFLHLMAEYRCRKFLFLGVYCILQRKKN